MTHRTQNAVRLLVGTLLLVAWTGCAEQQNQQAALTPEMSGRATYEEYCMNCHGDQAKGDGPVADLLKVAPPDLTQLTVKYGGTFPTTRVYETVDGREQLESHGTRQMPVWGNIWTDADGSPAAEQKIEKQINQVVEYLRTLQVESEM